MTHLANELAAAVRLVHVVDGLEQADKVLPAESLRISSELLCTCCSSSRAPVRPVGGSRPLRVAVEASAGHIAQHESSTTAP